MALQKANRASDEVDERRLSQSYVEKKSKEIAKYLFSKRLVGLLTRIVYNLLVVAIKIIAFICSINVSMFNFLIF